MEQLWIPHIGNNTGSQATFGRFNGWSGDSVMGEFDTNGLDAAAFLPSKVLTYFIDA